MTNGAREQYIEAELARKHGSSTAAAAAHSSLSSSSGLAAALSHAAQQRLQQEQRGEDRSSDDDDDDDDEEEDDENDDDDIFDQEAAKIFAEYAGKLTNAKQVPEKHTALQGKLMEVDLGDEVRSRNAAMTERARRRLLGEEVDDDDDDERKTGRPTKVRLGRDGKPWRPRKRRGSDDVKRDRIVEEILRENKCELPTCLHIMTTLPYPPLSRAYRSSISSAMIPFFVFLFVCLFVCSSLIIR